jgi:hypothetical protein
MTTPSPDEHPTVIQQATAQQPAVTAAPATRRTAIWQRRVPARIGRARTSTVVIGSLFVLLSALSAVVRPDPVQYTNIVDANTGATVRVPASLVPVAPTIAPTTPATPTDQAPPSQSTSISTPTGTTGTPRTTSGAPRTTTDAPTTTAPRSSTAPRDEQTTPAPTTSRAPATTSRAPATTAEETSSAPTP